MGSFDAMNGASFLRLLGLQPQTAAAEEFLDEFQKEKQVWPNKTRDCKVLNWKMQHDAVLTLGLTYQGKITCGFPRFPYKHDGYPATRMSLYQRVATMT